MREMIVSDPQIMMGKPVVRGTRITTESIVERVGAGESIEAIVGAHPGLTREAVLAAISFAAEALKAGLSIRPPSHPCIAEGILLPALPDAPSVLINAAGDRGRVPGGDC